MALGFMLMVTSLLLLATGLIGEMMTRIYFEAGRGRTYAVRRVLRKGGETHAE
jgi:hypothetical protein